RGRPEPEVVVEPRRRLAVGGRAESRHDIPIGPHAHRDDPPDVAVADQPPRPLIMRPGALLGPHLDDAMMPPRHVDHPPPLADEEARRLLDVDVLAGGAG